MRSKTAKALRRAARMITEGNPDREYIIGPAKKLLNGSKQFPTSLSPRPGIISVLTRRSTRKVYKALKKVTKNAVRQASYSGGGNPLPHRPSTSGNPRVLVQP